ncbi:superoxide dismutase [Suttonella ornithocola]|uniref:Superoxide dismutase n=1 Tax=Suttonella ornithocola TaxID=279832 RepID=A0A380MYD6_9GAMM|nr:superoxide dismutase [Suttonella ornithocola]SUO97575.1 Superoxide dismutase [Mn] [Suttonella ornithocola]
MSYTFQELPYAYNALEPVIDEATMHLHKDKHHKGYFDKFTAAIKETDYDGKPLAEIFKNISKLGAGIRNNGGGYYNHDLYFNGMRAPQENNAPTGELLDAIKEAFGSFEDFQKTFADAAANQFGSGWGWLIVKNGKLVVTHTPNQDNPLMDVAEEQGTPILGCDVWEHAYYLNYQNKRPDYIANWWKVVNWDYVAEQYANAK